MVKLMKYQQELIDNSKKNFMYITDTGTGKTYISIFHFLKYNTYNKLLIIMPAKKLQEGGWEREIKKIQTSLGINFPFICMTYDIFRIKLKKILEIEKIKNKKNKTKEEEEIIKNFTEENFENYFLILDEAHFIKNETSQRTKFFKEFVKKIPLDGFCLLTATPTPNGYKDYSTYLEIFGEINSAYEFKKKYGIPNKILLQKYRAYEPVAWKNTDEIDKMYNKFTSVPLKKEDCLDLPPLVIDTLYFDKSLEYKAIEFIVNEIPNNLLISYLGDYKNPKQKEEEKKIIKDIIFQTKDRITKKIKGKDEIENKILGILYSENDIITSTMKILTMQRIFGNLREKVAYLEEFLQTTNENVLIFYNFNFEYECIVKMLENFNKNYKENKKTFYVVNGKKTSIPEFEDFDKVKNSVTLIQIQAGSAAIELQYATQVFYFSPTWSYQDYYQSLGRAYRNGQKKKVSVHFMLTKDTFEEKVYDKLQQKKDFDIKTILKRKKKTLNF